MEQSLLLPRLEGWSDDPEKIGDGVEWDGVKNKGERETEREKKMHRVRKRGRNPSLALSDCSSSVIIPLTH